MTIAERLRVLVDALPTDSAVTLPTSTLRAWLAEDQPSLPTILATEPEPWRERLWACPADTRLGVEEVKEALDRSADWVYRAVSPKEAEKRGREPLPCQRLDGVLVFTAGSVRDWIERNELVVNPPLTARRLRTA